MSNNEVQGLITKSIKYDPYVSCARRDFLVAKKLNSEEGHVDSCNIIFHLEQCVEKLNKFIFINLVTPFEEITEDKELSLDEIVKTHKRKISHNQVKLFFELIRLIKIIFPKIGISNPSEFSRTLLLDLGVDLKSNAEENYEVLLSKTDEIANLSTTRLHHLLNIADGLTKKLKSSRGVDIANIVSKIKLEVSAETAEYMEKDSETKSQKFNIDQSQLLNENFDAIWHLLMESFPRLIIYGLILYPHESSTRYPYSIIPPEKYDYQEVGISNRYIIRRIIGGLEEFFSNLDKPTE